MSTYLSTLLQGDLTNSVCVCVCVCEFMRRWMLSSIMFLLYHLCPLFRSGVAMSTACVNLPSLSLLISLASSGRGDITYTHTHD